MKYFLLSFFCLHLCISALAGCRFMNDLNGSNIQMGTMLVWSTDLEENTGQFIVERSLDGSTFDQVGSVEAAGNTDELTDYHFLDIMATPEFPFYRLRVVDLDGSFSHSTVVEVASATNNFMVADMSGTNVTGSFEVTVDALTEGTLDYRLEDWFGIELLQRELPVINGLNNLVVDMRTHPEGIYKLHLVMGPEHEVLVFKKMLEEVGSPRPVASKDGNSSSDGRN